MRVALVTAAFRARSPIDLASHVRSLAPALARAGVSVEVFAGTTGSGLVPYAQRRSELVEPVSGTTYGVTVIELEADPDQARVAEAFGAFLKRERPKVCHFEHLDPMGVGLVREAKVRRISTLYAAHDTWPAHDRVSLTQPDLSPFELGDTEAEARALCAERVLEAEGLEPESDAYEARLPHLLHGDLTDPVEAAHLRAARESIEMRRAEKRVALSGVDRRFAASRLLSRELSAAVGRAFTFRAPGVDKAVIASVYEGATQGAVTQESVGAGYASIDFAAATEGAGTGSSPERAKGPIRLVFMGTTERAAGVHVLLDAVAAVRATETNPRFSLRLALERTDDRRDAQIHARAGELNVDVVWSRGRSVDAIGTLDGADLLVVPSIWGEVAPSTLRIALAAGVPIVASRMPGVVEAAPSTASVLVTPGSSESLAEALTKLCDPDGAAALKSMRSAAQSEQDANTKSVDDEALEWIDTYESLTDAAEAVERARNHVATSGEREAEGLSGQEPFGGQRKADPKRLASLVEVEEQLAELRGLSNTELFARAQAGVSHLRQAFGLKDSDAELLARVVSRGGSLRDRAEHDGATRKEVARAVHDLRLAQAALEAEESVRSRRIADLHKVLEQYEHEVAARAKDASDAAAAAEAAKAEASSAVSAKEAAEAIAEGAESKIASVREEAEAKVESAEKKAVELTASLAEAEAAHETLAAEKTKVAGEAAEAERLYREVVVQVESAKKALLDTEAARDQLAMSIEDRSAEIRAVRERLVRPSSSEHDEVEAQEGEADVLKDLESIEAYCVSLERDLDALKRNDDWVAGEADGLIDTLSEAAATTAATTAGPSDQAESRAGEASSKEGQDSPAELARISTRLERVTVELNWRRSEMEHAVKAADSKRVRFLAGPLGKRLRAWGKPPEDVVLSMTALASVSTRPEGSELAGDAGIDPAQDSDGAENPADDPGEDPGEDPAAPLPSSSSDAASESAEMDSADGDSTVQASASNDDDEVKS